LNRLTQSRIDEHGHRHTLLDDSVVAWANPTGSHAQYGSDDAQNRPRAVCSSRKFREELSQFGSRHMDALQAAIDKVGVSVAAGTASDEEWECHQTLVELWRGIPLNDGRRTVWDVLCAVRRYDDDVPNALDWRSKSTYPPKSCPDSLDEAWNCILDIEGSGFSPPVETHVIRSAQKFVANPNIASRPTRLLCIRVQAPGELRAEFWCHGCLAKPGGCGREGIHVLKTRFSSDRGVDRVEWERHCPAVQGPGSAQRGFENIDSAAAAVLMRDRAKWGLDQQLWRDTRGPTVSLAATGECEQECRKRKRDTVFALRMKETIAECEKRDLVREVRARLLASAAKLERGE
jgi:hypothetical protein